MGVVHKPKPEVEEKLWCDGKVFAVGDCNYGCIGKPGKAPEPKPNQNPCQRPGTVHCHLSQRYHIQAKSRPCMLSSISRPWRRRREESKLSSKTHGGPGGQACSQRAWVRTTLALSW